MNNSNKLFLIYNNEEILITDYQINFSEKNLLSNTLKKNLEFNKEYTLASPSSFYPYAVIEFDNIQYHLVYNDDYEVLSIFCFDNEFKTDENLKIELQIEINTEDITYFPSWYILGKTTIDQWEPILEINSEYYQLLETGSKMKIKAKIIGFYKFLR